MRYSIKLSYSGADFCGWQVQPDAPSVQQTLQEALSTLLRAAVAVTGAGRTDTGVNAIGYIAHFDAAEGLDTHNLCYKLNAILPRSVVVHDIAPAAEDFHARFDATRREYTYFLHRSKDPFVEAFSWQCGYPGLDFEAMNSAAGLLVGTHDFSCFEKVGADNKTSVCTVFEAYWKPYVPGFRTVIPSEAKESRYWYFRISADRFLRNMVRAIVGTLIEVGRGKRSLDDFAGLIFEGALPPNTPRSSQATDIACNAGSVPPSAGRSEDRHEPSLRSLAGESVPGHALFLSKVEY